MHPQEQAIHATLAQTLLAGRLAPGTQLIETRLAQIFGVSRERVRKVLHRLGHERLLELIPNRGCFVSNPTLAQAREIYEARRIVEGGLVGQLRGPAVGRAAGRAAGPWRTRARGPARAGPGALHPAQR